MLAGPAVNAVPVGEAVDRAILQRLARADTPTICNIIELLGLRDRSAGFAGPAITARYPHLPPICGYAVTATFRSAYSAGAGETHAGLAGFLRHLLPLPQPRIVVIQDLDDPPRGVVYGEMIARSLRKFGCIGLITNGLGRDVQQVGQLDFPCWTSGVVASHAHLRIEQVGVPVCVAGLTVKPGDVLHADGNGVVQIPADAAPVIESGIDAFLKAEVGLIDWDEQGDPDLEQWQKIWDDKAKAIAQLKARLLERWQRRQAQP
jgi:regulator of RNase E activity RraA